MAAINITLHRYYSAKAWVARITGTDTRYGLARQFCCPVERSSSKSGATGDAIYELTPGLYQVGGGKQVIRDHGEYRIVWIKAGKLTWCAVDASRAKAIARLMDDGKDFESARLATRKPAAPKMVAQEGG